MPGIHEPQLVNTLGHSAGAIIFGIFLYLMLRDRSGTRLRGNWLSFTAASLAFLWNAGSLTVLIASRVGATEREWIVFFCFAVLSFLPAVLLHLSLEESLAPLVACGYLLSTAAVGINFWELFHPSASYQRMGLVLITVGFGILTTIAVLCVAFQRDSRTHARVSRISGAMCSMLLAISFVHFGSGHPAQAWSQELAFHHAGIPLALFVLLQDYRFILLDAFIRFLANALLAAVLTFAAIRIAFRFVTINPRIGSNPFYESVLLMGLCMLFIAFALIRGRVQQWLTRVVFRRGDLNKSLQEIRSAKSVLQREDEFLAWAAGLIADFMNTDECEEVGGIELAKVLGDADLVVPVPASDVPRLQDFNRFAWVEAVVPLRPGRCTVRYVLLGRRRGGRRYWSEDLRSLNRLAAAVSEQAEQFRELEMQRLVSQAELRALQSQVNPHFLFNALNTIYGVIPREASSARKTVLNLADIFRYFLQSEKTFIPLYEELAIVKAYLEIERLRLGMRLTAEIDIDESALNTPIPILSIEPLVENAIKHGLSETRPGFVRLEGRMLNGELVVTVEDNGRGMIPLGKQSGNLRQGVGLTNVERRLQICYGTHAKLWIESCSEGTKVRFVIPTVVQGVEDGAKGVATQPLQKSSA